MCGRTCEFCTMYFAGHYCPENCPDGRMHRVWTQWATGSGEASRQSSRRSRSQGTSGHTRPMCQRLRPRPVTAPPPSGNAGSTRLRLRTLGPAGEPHPPFLRTCAPAGGGTDADFFSGTIFFTTYTHTDQQQKQLQRADSPSGRKGDLSGGTGGYSREAQPEGGPHHERGEAGSWDAAQCVGGIGARRSLAASVV